MTLKPEQGWSSQKNLGLQSELYKPGNNGMIYLSIEVCGIWKTINPIPNNTSFKIWDGHEKRQVKAGRICSQNMYSIKGYSLK